MATTRLTTGGELQNKEAKDKAVTQAKSKAEYLQRYLQPVETKQKKRRRKRTEQKVTSSTKIVDVDEQSKAPILAKPERKPKISHSSLKDMAVEEEEDEEDRPVVVVTEEPALAKPEGRTDNWVTVSEPSTAPSHRRRDSPTTSPPRRRHDSPTTSPPRRRRDSTTTSPPRRRHDSPTNSPPRRRHDSPTTSPPRRRHDSPTTSPPRRRHDSPSPSAGRGRQDSPKVSEPPTKRPKASGGGETPEASKLAGDSHRPANELSSGISAGLHTATQLGAEARRAKRERDDRWNKTDPRTLGQGAETVYRDRKGRKLEMLNEMLRTDRRETNEEEAQMEWGVGLVQKKQKEDSKLRELEEKNQPFARAPDDPELDRHYKAIERWGDPMAALLHEEKKTKKHRKSKKDKKDKKDKMERPQTCKYRPTPNRFNILPGPHWDGVDRSSGFEKKYFERQSASMARTKEAYAWSVADM